MISRFMLSSIFAFTVAAAAVWATCKMAIKMGVVDLPGPLKIHRGPVPRLGGIGIFFGFLAGATVAPQSLLTHEWHLLIALLLIWMTGLVDDLRPLTPILRLAIQIIAGVLVYRAGISSVHISPAFLDPVNAIITIIVFINAVNFLDGSDGLAAGTGAIAATGFAILMARSVPAWSLLAASVAAASCGFLVFNFAPAKIFMGDSGSTVLGFLLALIALRFDKFVGHISVIPLIIMAIPLIDFVLTVFRRLFSGRSLFEGDRSHFYDFLLRMGWSPRRIALSTYAAAICAVALALAVRA